MKEQQAKPFLKWAGGKTQLLTAIASKIAYKNQDSFIYVEPFVGSAAVLFWILNHYSNLEKVVINDINSDLTNAYKIIQKEVNFLINILKKLANEYYSYSDNKDFKKAYYYSKRELFNTRKSNPIEQTALFIFLNRTCFNGLYRVNRKNEFNVPMGSYKKPMICDENNLRTVSQLLQKVEILNDDFEKTLDYANSNSFFYLDPPYKPLSSTSNFNSYAKIKFNDNEQIRLKNFCDKLDLQQSKWMLSNSDVKGENPDNNFFDDLYQNYKINRVSARRSINSNGSKRGKLSELLITN